MKNTLIVNLLGGPGVGKSTAMAGIFAKLKSLDVDCEIVTEFAKDLVWDERHETFKDEIYIFAKQEHRLFRVNGKVDVIITDRPLILTCFYGQANPALSALCASEFNKYNNLNFILKRVKHYNPNGRNQTEAEAKEIDEELRIIANNLRIPYEEVPGDDSAVDIVCKKVLEMLGTVDGNNGGETKKIPAETPLISPILIKDNSDDPCESCPNRFGPRDGLGNPIVGDSPCQWCRHYKWKITWTSYSDNTFAEGCKYITDNSLNTGEKK